MSKRILILAAAAMIAAVAGCSSSECSANADCLSRGSDFVCSNSRCVVKLTQDAGSDACNPACSGATPACDISTKSCVACVDNSTCSGATPACDISTHSCVACTDSSSCSGATPVCDTSTNTCVACTDNSSCGSGSVCDVGTETCVQCVTSNDCSATPSTPICDATNHTCTAACSTDNDCSVTPGTPKCDTGSNICVACTDNSTCSGSTPVCDTSTHSCVACAGDSDCNAGNVCDPSTNTCVGCVDSTNCGGATPVCEPNSQTCVQCVSDGQCSNGDICDPSSHSCVAVIDCSADSSVCSGTSTPVCNGTYCVQCNSGDTSACTGGTPICNTTTSKCVQCVDNSTCGSGEDCQTDTGSCGSVDMTTGSTQIGTVVAYAIDGGTTSGLSLDVQNPVVTYVRPDVSGFSGFFVQALKDGPGLLVVADAGTVNVGDRVSFTVTDLSTYHNMPEVDAFTGLTVSSSGHPVDDLRTDISAETDAGTLLGETGKLISMGFTADGAVSNAGTDYKYVYADTTGLPSGDVELYGINSVFDQNDITAGCIGSLTNGVLMVYNSTVEASTWNPAEITLTSCPAPTVVKALATDSTHLTVTFDREIAVASVGAAAFTIDNGLSVSAAVGDGSNVVTLTTSAQTEGTTYTLTVGSAVTDDRGTSVGNPNTTTFTGFVVPAVLRLTQINPNISTSNGGDMVELTAISGGSINNMTLLDMSNASPTKKATLPDMKVATGDKILIHVTQSTLPCTETTDKATDCPAGSNAHFSDTAWDVPGGGSGFSFTDKVIAITGLDGTTIVDEAVFTKSGTSATKFVQAAQDAENNGFWVGVPVPPVTCADQASCEADAVDWGSLTSATTTSATRSATTIPGAASQWSTGTSSW